MASDDQIAALYQKEIRDLAASVRNDRRLSSPDATVTKRSRICGSSVTLDVSFCEGRIKAVGYRARACSLGMAATAVVVRVSPGQNAAGITEAKETLAALLAGDDVTFPPGWGQLKLFTAAIPFRTRHESILLALQAAEAAFSA